MAAGIAWGEWGAEDFKDAAVRQEIMAASGNVAPPEAVPQGLERLSSIWTAPMPDYAPSFMHNESFGYIMSALVGGGLIILLFLLISRLVSEGAPTASRAR
jgi:cobalt/nickel transport system permease protein